MIFTLTMELHPLCYVKLFFYARIYWRAKSKTVSPLISLAVFIMLKSLIKYPLKKGQVNPILVKMFEIMSK